MFFKTTLFILFSFFFSDCYAMENTEQEEAFYHISSCYRQFPSKENGKEKLRHCFIKFGNGNTKAHIDSRGFFQQGSMQEGNLDNSVCRLEKENATRKDWVKITEVYDEHKDHHYDLLNVNCCTVAVKALQAIGIKNTHLYNANFGIGTRIQPKVIAEKCNFNNSSERNAIEKSDGSNKRKS